MKKIKQLAAAAAALIAVTSVTACDESTELPSTNAPSNAPSASTSSSTTSGVPSTMKEEDAKTISDIEVQEFNLENKTIRFLSSWPMNPANGKAVPVSLEMFEQKYGGKVEDIVCAWDARYDQLAAMVSSGDSPDFFSAADLDNFPKGAIYNMFEPLDQYIDFDSELWQPTKEINDWFIFKGNHYVATVGADAGTVMIYNKRTIENYGLDDPQELLANDNWTWDTFWEMMVDFCDVDDDRYAIDGWWFVNAFNATTGVPFISM
ncbi:MAG: extracellular solute-binding protein, partial [Oscillospiraceae bacterium]